LQGLLRAFEEAAESRSGGVFHFTQRLEDGTCRNLRVSLKYWGKTRPQKLFLRNFLFCPAIKSDFFERGDS
jgi:hypothetical protein